MRRGLEPGQSTDAAYLRAAQAYMLISMPTGTSTIFGAFQAISISRMLRRDCRSPSKIGPPRRQRKRVSARPDPDKGPAGKMLQCKMNWHRGDTPDYRGPRNDRQVLNCGLQDLVCRTWFARPDL
jgi:hypothetical protein